MYRLFTTLTVLTLGVTGGAAGALAAAHVAQGQDLVHHQQSRLLDREVLPAKTFREGSPPSGSALTEQNRKDAAANGILGPATGPYFDRQPVQGFSAVVPVGDGTWWALGDNGYGTRESSADWQLVLYRIDPHFGDPSSPEVISTVLLRDPGRHVPWRTVCDPTYGADLPPFSFNALPTEPPSACSGDPAARLLTGFDFDPESVQVGRDGTFWIGDEFGPFLLHADRRGRLLEAPIGAPGLKAPQNPTLNVLGGEEPTVAQSRGFENLAISPDRTTLYPMTEGAVADDDPQDLRILQFDIRSRHFSRSVQYLRLEMPGAKVNLAPLLLADGSAAYPGSVAPTGTGGESAAELTAVNADQFLVVERDSAGDAVVAPRMKKVFMLDGIGDKHRRYVVKSPLVDLMAVPDPGQVGGDGDFFRFPFNTIESVHVASASTIVVANDNNLPFSNARARSRTNERTGPLAADDNELILVGLGTRLRVDHRLLSAPTP